MTYTPYYLSKLQWCWRPSTTIHNTTNVNTDTFYHTPIEISQANNILTREQAEYVEYRGASRYANRMHLIGYTIPDLTLSGPVLDHSWLHQLTAAQETAADTPGAGYHTHEFDLTGHTPVATPPMIDLLGYHPNAGDGAALNHLFSGCFITNYQEDLNINQANEVMIGSYGIKLGREVSAGGTTLTSPGYPSYPDHIFTKAHLTPTINDAGSAIQGVLRGYTYTYSTDRRFGPVGGSYYPTRIYNENNTDINLQLRFEDFDDNHDKYNQDPTTANNIDADLNFVRTANQDEWKIDFIDGIYTQPIYTFADGQQLTTLNVKYNGKEASGNHKLTEINNLDNTRYGGV